jgi:beta-lactamase regulating signal transducer with metallopeptidase domain
VSALAESLLTALVLSGLAACCLALLPRTPPLVRFCIAVFGLAVWLVPWGAIRIALPSSSALPLVEWFRAAEASVPLPPKTSSDASAVLGVAVAAAFLVGAMLFVRDCVALRRCLRGWRARSRSGEHLRALLPRELAALAVDIRIVAGSAVAAASGVRKPTVWLGDRHTQAQLEVALVHELWHVRARDPLAVGLIAGVRRAYWWNPLVAYLARHAVLMIESRCDHRCAAQLGKARYRAQLAALLLAGTAPAPRLVAAIGAGNPDVQRLRLLGEPLLVRARDAALVAALAVSATGTAAAVVVERSAPPLAATPFIAAALSGGNLPATPAGNALAAVLRAANAGDSAQLGELLGAYTPQELPLPLPHASRDARVVDVLHSDPLRIEYVVEGRANGPRYVGEIAVTDTPSARITELSTKLLAW